MFCELFSLDCYNCNVHFFFNRTVIHESIQMFTIRRQQIFFLVFRRTFLWRSDCCRLESSRMRVATQMLHVLRNRGHSWGTQYAWEELPLLQMPNITHIIWFVKLTQIGVSTQTSARGHFTSADVFPVWNPSTLSKVRVVYNTSQPLLVWTEWLHSAACERESEHFYSGLWKKYWWLSQRKNKWEREGWHCQHPFVLLE